MGNEYVQDYSIQEKLIRSRIDTAKNEGLAEGERNKQLEIAKMIIKNTNTSLEKISLCTGLSIEEVTKLKNEIN